MGEGPRTEADWPIQSVFPPDGGGVLLAGALHPRSGMVQQRNPGIPGRRASRSEEPGRAHLLQSAYSVRSEAVVV